MNDYLSALEGMPKLLNCCGNPMAMFTKKLYPSEFQKVYQQNLGTFDALERVYNTVIDREQMLKNMADALVAEAVRSVEECGRRSAKERRQMDLNMAMAVFVFPMVLEFRGNSSQPLADALLEAWKETFPKSGIQAAGYSEIEQGFHKKFCYITTAVCECLGKPDDCYELTLLRDYRDTYLAALPDGDALIRQYYDVAPSVVKHINQSGKASEVYRSIWDEYLAPCIALIEQGRNEACRARYEDMVRTLRDQYFIAQF